MNVLVALLDSDHVDHEIAWRWLDAEVEQGWASCAITENGFVRIVSQPRYPSPVSPSQAIQRLARATRTRHHEYWPCSISLLDDAIIDRSRLHGTLQVTDAYLLALAVERGGRFVTLDRSVPLNAVHGADAAHLAVLR